MKQFSSGGMSKRKAQDWTEVKEAGQDCKAREMRMKGKDLQADSEGQKKKPEECQVTSSI